MAEPHESRIYSDFARFYDAVFVRAFLVHEHEVVESLNCGPASACSRSESAPGCRSTRFRLTFSWSGSIRRTAMLAHAHEKIRENGWRHIEVKQGDALNLDFPDNSFDDVVSFHVITVVPDPIKMMNEMVRVCKPGGRIVVVNHFASPNPVLYFLNTLINPLTKLLGWTTRLRARDVLHDPNIKVEKLAPVARFSVHDLIIARKLA